MCIRDRFENIAFWEVPRGNHKCRSRDATPLVNNKLESVQLRRHCNSTATPTSLQSIWHIISIFCFFLFENIALWEVPRGNHKCRSRDAMTLVNNKRESMQLQALHLERRTTLRQTLWVFRACLAVSYTHLTLPTKRIV